LQTFKIILLTQFYSNAVKSAVLICKWTLNLCDDDDNDDMYHYLRVCDGEPSGCGVQKRYLRLTQMSGSIRPPPSTR